MRSVKEINNTKVSPSFLDFKLSIRGQSRISQWGDCTQHTLQLHSHLIHCASFRDSGWREE